MVYKCSYRLQEAYFYLHSSSSLACYEIYLNSRLKMIFLVNTKIIFHILPQNYIECPLFIFKHMRHKGG